MSKRRAIGRKSVNQRSYGADARTDVEITRELLDQFADNRFTHLPREICEFLDSYAESCVDHYWPKRVRRDAPLSRRHVAVMLRRAVHDGYRWAIMDYSEDLEISDEAKVDHDKRLKGGDEGRAKQSNRKQSRQTQAKEMLNAGVDEKAIAGHFGVHVSTVYRWLMPSASPAPKATRKPKRHP